MQQTAQNLMQVIQNTPVARIADLDLVKARYIQNYNSTHRQKVGEIQYHKNMVHLKQIISASQQLQQCDPFSVYAVIATAAANGYSLDPADGEVYIIARGGKACIDRQAGAHVRRLIRSGQVQFFEQAKLVYEGDVFNVQNGRVLQHIETFKSEKIMAGYVRVVLDANGADRYFIYRKSDWQAWRKKSTNPVTKELPSRNGGTYLKESLWDNGIVGGDPEPGFLRTKIIKHAANEKCFAAGSDFAGVERYEGVEVDTDGEDLKADLPEPPAGASYAPTMIVTPATDEDDFTAPPPAAGQQVQPADDDENF